MTTLTQKNQLTKLWNAAKSKVNKFSNFNSLYVEVLNYKKKTLDRDYNKNFEDFFNLFDLEKCGKISKVEVIHSLI